MSTTRKAEEVFLSVSELPPERWESGIVRLCNGDIALASEVRSLLGFHGKAENFLDANELLAHSLVFGRVRLPADEELAPGTRVGVYRIQSLLGAGGMGSVYVAEQERPRRTVALKVIRRGLSTQALLKRFEHEAEVLGRLQHPGIAQVFEAGSAPLIAPDGLRREDQPFIAMEYIRGTSLTKHCEHAQLDVLERLRLVAKVCDAVHHAHQRGVIHRDLKPANILVESDGSPKILDFGVARAADADIRVTTMQTSVGQLIGTLPYMSPEQVLGDPREVDTRSDVYALGVILYQLLTGRLPHDVGSRSIPEAARVIREESPTKLSNVSKVFRGEVDTIVSKALEKDKHRRYQSAADLGDDIRRYLAGEPIHAKQDSALYVLRKQLKRYKWAAAAAVVAAMTLVSFTVYAIAQAQRERHLAQIARDERTVAFAAKDAAERARELEASARTRADIASSRLVDELNYARTERGRLEGLLGNIPLAEQSLWGAKFERPDDPTTTWALREFFFRYPYEWTVQLASGGMRCSAFAPGAPLFVVGTTSGIGLYSTTDGSPMRRITSLGSGVSLIALAPDATFCFAALDNGRIMRVQLVGDAACTPLMHTPPHGGAVRALVLSPDGTLVASAGVDRKVRVWDAATLQELAAWPAHSEPTTALAFRADSAVLATSPAPVLMPGSTQSTSVRVWRLSDLELLQEFPVAPRNAATALCFEGNDRTLLIGTSNQFLVRADFQTGDQQQIALPSNAISVQAFAPSLQDATTLMAIGDTLWEARPSGVRSLPSIGLQSQSIMNFGVDQNSVIIITRDGIARRVARSHEFLRSRIDGFDSWCFGVAYSPDASLLVVAGGWNHIRVVDARTLELITSIAMPTTFHRSRIVRFLRGSEVFLAGGADGIVWFIEARTGKILAQVPSGGPEIFSMELSPDQSMLATGHADGSIRVWDTTSCTFEVLRQRMPRRVEGVAFTPDGSLMFTSGLSGGVQVWDVATREPVVVIATTGMPWAVACSPDGSRLLVSTYSGVIDAFDGDFRFLSQLRAHRRLIPGLAFSPDGSLFASASEDSTVRVWDARTLRSLASLETGGSEVVSVAFSPDSTRIAATNAARFTTVYNFPRVDQLIAANEPVQRTLFGRRRAAPVTP